MFHLIQADAWEAPYIGLIIVIVLIGLAVWAKIDENTSKPKHTQLNQNLNKAHSVEEVVEKPVKVNEPRQNTIMIWTEFRR